MITKRDFILRGSCFCEKYMFRRLRMPEFRDPGGDSYTLHKSSKFLGASDMMVALLQYTPLITRGAFQLYHIWVKSKNVSVIHFNYIVELKEIIHRNKNTSITDVYFKY